MEDKEEMKTHNKDEKQTTKVNHGRNRGNGKKK